MTKVRAIALSDTFESPTSAPDIERSNVVSITVGLEASAEREAYRNQQHRRLSTEDLYPALEHGSFSLRRAVSLLDEARNRVMEALHAHGNGDEIGADLAMQRLFVLLPELFCCRDLGDGFGAVVNAVQASIENLDGRPAGTADVRAIGTALAAIQARPFMKMEGALDEIVKLEEAGLVIEPAGYEVIADWVNGESFR